MGTKLTLLAPVAALASGWRCSPGAGGGFADAGVFLAAVIAGGGFWYLRNLVHSGNPLPWIDEIGPISLPAPEVALELRPPFSVAHYATDFDVWREWFGPGLDRLGSGPSGRSSWLLAARRRAVACDRPARPLCRSSAASPSSPSSPTCSPH